MIRTPAFRAIILALPLSLGISQDIEPQHSPGTGPESSASVGLVLDNSKSMSNKRDAMVAAMHLLVDGSSPKDEFFVVNFNEEPMLELSQPTGS